MGFFYSFSQLFLALGCFPAGPTLPVVPSILHTTRCASCAKCILTMPREPEEGTGTHGRAVPLVLGSCSSSLAGCRHYQHNQCWRPVSLLFFYYLQSDTGGRSSTEMFLTRPGHGEGILCSSCREQLQERSIRSTAPTPLTWTWVMARRRGLQSAPEPQNPLQKPCKDLARPSERGEPSQAARASSRAEPFAQISLSLALYSEYGQIQASPCIFPPG